MTSPAPGPRNTLPVTMRAAVAVAALYFPEGSSPDGGRLVSRAMACFVLDGHLEAWSGWSRLHAEHQRRLTRLLRHRHNQLANAQLAGEHLDRFLMAGALPGCAPADDYAENGTIVVAPGMPLLDFADACLDDVAALHTAREGCLPAAVPGHYRTTIFVPGPGVASTVTDVRFDIRDHHVAGQQVPPAILDAAPLLTLTVPFSELEDIAAALDAASGTKYRTEAVQRFIKQARRPGGGAADVLDLEAGPLNELIAYTGFGKSVVLTETFACWAARNGVVVTFAVPTNADVVRSAHQIERALGLLGCDVMVTPLMSPRSVLTVAEAAAGSTTQNGPGADWIWSQLGYGCALAAAATADKQVDAWQPGQEPCRSLRRLDGSRRQDPVAACPWRGSCGKFALVRAACTAGIIVTSHANLLAGRLQTPVDNGHGITDQVTVEELILRRSHVLVIDEIDSFQRTALDHAGRGLLLDRAGHTDTPLRLLDAEFSAAFGRVHEDVDASVRDACSATRFLSENYVSHLHYGRLGPTATDTRRPRGPSRHWVVPRRWDAWLTARLFGLDKETPVTDRQLKMFTSLFAGGSGPEPEEPGFFRQLRPGLRAIISSGPEGRAISDIRATLDHALEGTVTDERDQVINRMLRRAILEQIRFHLYQLMANTPQLSAAGVESTQLIADALGSYGRWRATPTGPLGRLVFAFTEHRDDTGDEPTRLTTAAFGGDPHVYTVSLGDTTALAMAGTRRIVLGLSATAYFPFAPHYHVHVPPRWRVSDENPGTVTIDAASVDTRISGLDEPSRTENTRLLAQRLWARRLDAELQHLHQEDPGRARVLLATTSYDGARLVAEGLAAAGVAARRICLAVRPHRDEVPRPGGHVVTDAGAWLELPADRLEDFPAVNGADILIAPLARVQRGVNIIGEGDKSALGSVWLLVRPVPVIDEPAELVAHLQAKALADHPGPAEDPLPILRDRRNAAGQYFEEIVSRPPYFQAQPAQVKLSVTAEIINNAIQLIGRARRGGTPAVLHLVDEAFHDAQAGTDFATLVTRLRAAWDDAGTLQQIRQLYGTTLDAFFDYADRNTPVPQPGPDASGATPC